MGNPRTMALVGYTAPIFIPFATALQNHGFRIHWIHSLRSATERLLTTGVDRARIRDVSDWRRFEPDIDIAHRLLSGLERPGLPRINDLILMDRRVRTKPYEFALRYLATLARELNALIDEDGVRCFASGRDTSLQMMALLVANARGIPWAGATYMRLPNERFMLTRAHVTDTVYPLGEVTAEHVAAAREYVAGFRQNALRPYVLASSSSWGGVVRRLPLHLREGWRLLRDTRHDAGNDFARYPLAVLARMYLRKKWQLLQSNLFLRAQPGAGSRPYVYFGLHRQPESSVDVLGAWFSDQPYFVRTIARSVPLGHDLYVKLHISDVDGWPLDFYRMLEKIPAVKIIAPTADSRKLLSGAALTVTNSGTMAFEAGLLGKPAITFARVHFNELPTLRFCDSPPALPALIDEQLARKPQPGDDEAIVEFMARMFAWSASGLPNRSIFDTGLRDSDLASLVDTYQKLYDGFAPAEPDENAR